MISYLSGSILAVNDKTITLNVHDVGYEIRVVDPHHSLYKEGNRAALFTYLHVREDVLELYGFAQKQEREIFLHLLRVSGIGPKMALSILERASAEEIVKAVARQDVTFLTIKGVGKKTAEKIIHELKEKIGLPETMTPTNYSDVADALRSLGYTSAQIAHALSNLPKGVTSPEDQVRVALKLLNSIS